MTLSPTSAEQVSRARADLRLGLPVAVTGAGGTLLAAAAETVSAARLAGLRARGPLVMAVTGWRAETLRLRPYDGAIARLVLPPEADLDLVRALADPAADLAWPLKGPFVQPRGAGAERFRAAVALARTAPLLPAVVGVELGAGGAVPAELVQVTLDALAEAAARPPHLHVVSAARVPMAVSRAGRLSVFRSDDGADEHYAVEIGRVDRAAAPLVRLHSACFTGDVLGSLKCDCGAQLHAAMAEMAAEGSGVLLYLGQEGRGIGLANKMRAYALQDQGFDTVEANHRLGFDDDERDFRVGAALLHRMGLTRVRLLTNNPRKVAMLGAGGIEVVERVPLKVGRGPLNAAYLDTKKNKSGHLL